METEEMEFLAWFVLIAGAGASVLAVLVLAFGRAVVKNRAGYEEKDEEENGEEELLPGETPKSRFQDSWDRLWQKVFFALSGVWFIAGLFCWQKVDAMRIAARPYLLSHADQLIVRKLVSSGSLFLLAGTLAAVSALGQFYGIAKRRAERKKRLREEAENPAGTGEPAEPDEAPAGPEGPAAVPLPAAPAGIGAGLAPLELDPIWQDADHAHGGPDLLP